MMRDDLIIDLKRQEGFLPYAYQDHIGYWTIGYGTLIDKRGGGLPEDICEELLKRRVDENIRLLNKALPWLARHPDNIKLALNNMAYQMGIAGLLKFKTTLDLIQKKKYNEAAEQALKSVWAKQTPGRAAYVTNLMRIQK